MQAAEQDFRSPVRRVDQAFRKAGPLFRLPVIRRLSTPCTRAWIRVSRGPPPKFDESQGNTPSKVKPVPPRSLCRANLAGRFKPEVQSSTSALAPGAAHATFTRLNRAPMIAPLCTATLQCMQHGSKQNGIFPWRAGCCVVFFLIATGLSHAQRGPGGGEGGRGSGTHSGGKKTAPTAARTLSLEDLMPPDPWRIWQERLLLDAPALGLRAEQLSPFNEFVHELGEASQFKGIRALRSMRGAPPVVSAVTDVARDFSLAVDDARDWINALQDLDSRWKALRTVLSPAQQALLDASYEASREAARVRLPGAPADGQSNARNGPPH